VLHDASLTNLVRYSAIEQTALDALVERIEAQYGAAEAEVARDPDIAGGDIEWLRYCARVPLTEVATEGSLGAVVHSWWHAHRIDGTLLGDVTVAPMPVPSADVGFAERGDNTTAALLDELHQDDLLMVTVGAVNANRRIDILLGAIANDPVLTNRVRMWAVGPAEKRAESDLLSLAETLGLRDRFRITGPVSPGLLEKILARADMSAALRDPVLEGQSASALKTMASGIPTIVLDHAHYSELPDEGAIKVDPNGAAAGVRTALLALAHDEHGRTRRGEAGRDFVVGSRTSAAYASALIEAGNKALAAKPLVNLSADLNSLLGRLNLNKEDAVVDAVSDIAFDLFELD
jgi:glycosyltransferase involved in cell wall biosynthesis